MGSKYTIFTRKENTSVDENKPKDNTITQPPPQNRERTNGGGSNAVNSQGVIIKREDNNRIDREGEVKDVRNRERNDNVSEDGAVILSVKYPKKPRIKREEDDNTDANTPNVLIKTEEEEEVPANIPIKKEEDEEDSVFDNVSIKTEEESEDEGSVNKESGVEAELSESELWEERAAAQREAEQMRLNEQNEHNQLNRSYDSETDVFDSMENYLGDDEHTDTDTEDENETRYGVFNEGNFDINNANSSQDDSYKSESSEIDNGEGDDASLNTFGSFFSYNDDGVPSASDVRNTQYFILQTEFAYGNPGNPGAFTDDSSDDEGRLVIDESDSSPLSSPGHLEIDEEYLCPSPPIQREKPKQYILPDDISELFRPSDPQTNEDGNNDNTTNNNNNNEFTFPPSPLTPHVGIHNQVRSLSPRSQLHYTSKKRSAIIFFTEDETHSTDESPAASSAPKLYTGEETYSTMLTPRSFVKDFGKRRFEEQEEEKDEIIEQEDEEDSGELFFKKTKQDGEFSGVFTQAIPSSPSKKRTREKDYDKEESAESEGSEEEEEEEEEEEYENTSSKKTRWGY
eukprot:TRINITY_DN4281_c0_g1_i10.p1 TRINITY_DN4281_c0_g1~~TRINITY_DN4281_c0_g1_i10.p1  ORF type:complete len:570 (-),score=180.33 TRINITY_DN4281_c0_g1_i10:2006-3715(-)